MYSVIALKQQFLEKHIEQFVKIVRQVDFQYWSKENFMLPLPGKWEVSFVAVESRNTDKIVGFIICSIKNGDILYEHKLFVDSDYRNQGIGKMLLYASLSKAKKMEIGTISLNVYEESENARGLYESLGFIKTSQTNDSIGLRFLLKGNIDAILKKLIK